MADVAYCGHKAVSPGSTCPDGTIATWGRNGTGGASSAPKPGASEESVVTGAVSWNTNTSPVPFTSRPSASYSGGIPGQDVEDIRPFNEAMSYLNKLRGKANAKNASKEDKNRYGNLLDDLRRYTGSKLGTIGGQELAWQTVLEDAQFSGVNALELLRGGPGRAGKQGGAGGPRASVTFASEPDLRSTADAIGSEVLGRGVTEEEFQRVLKKVRSAERSQPTVTTRMGGQTVTESGITAEGRKDLITDMLMQGPEAKEFTQATTMMDAFYKALSEGPRG